MTAPSRSGARLGWTPGPFAPRLAVGEVHIWKADLRQVGEEELRWLSLGERARAERFPAADKGRLWARSRGVLRRLLGAYVAADPGSLTLEVNINGKPALSGRHGWSKVCPQRPQSLCFNLSHSGRVALYAFASCPVGVDVELGRRIIDEVSVARRAFSAHTARRIARLPAPERRREFLRQWTRHEALLKCQGTGLGAAVLGDPGEQRRHDARTSGAPSPWLAELQLGQGAAGAVACMAAPRAVRRWRIAP
jgi:4'-phosphopantetheinyl transferase